MDDVFKCAILSSARKRRELPDAKLQTDALLRRHALPRLAEAGKHRPDGAGQARDAALPRAGAAHRDRGQTARMPASTRECRCAPSGRIRTSPARSFWRCFGNICRRISARSRSRKRRNGSTLAFRRCGKRIFTVSGTAMRPAYLKESMCMRSRARWILTPCAAPRHSFAGGTNSLPFPPERKRPRRHAHDRVYRDRTLRGRSAAYVYRRRILIQYGAHPDRHAARGRSRRAPSGRYGGDPCLAQPCECRFYRPGAGAFPLGRDVLSE